jgi:hypothetical protein
MEQAGMIRRSMISKSKLLLFVGSIVLGTSALMYAQDQREDPKPNETSRPAASKDEKARPAQDDKRGGTATPQDSRDQGAKAPEQNEDKAVRGEDRSSHQQDNNSRMEQRTDGNSQSNRETSNRDSRSERGTMQAQGNDHRSGGRIPEEQFKSHFGRQHTFAVSHPTVVGGQPQFQYGGYTFNIIGAWPADWSYSDEYYVDYINDDYVLFDLAHPGVSVAIVVVM